MSTIHLQSVGKVKAQEAKNIVVGTRLMWNFGSISKVIKIVKETPKTIVVKEQCEESGYVGERRLHKTRLVAIV